MLAHSWNVDICPRLWLMSEKFDGVRCICKNGKLFTRTGKAINAPSFFTSGLKNNVIYDGEIFGGYGNFDKTSGICRKKTPVTAEWKKLTYEIFDVVDTRFSRKAYKRQEMLTQAVRKNSKYHNVVKQIRCKGKDHLFAFLKEVEKRGGEGIMLRDDMSYYEHKRSRSLLKVKSFKDIDARVVDHQKGKGKNKRRLGAVVCELQGGKRFKCGSGFSDAQRNNPPKIGSLITVKYFEMTATNTPRFPTFVGVRAEQDMHT